MKRFVGLLLLAFALAAGYSIGSQFDPETLALSVGVLFGVLAGIPVALLVIAAGRRRDRDPDFDDVDPYGYPAYNVPRRGRRSLPQPQPPVIILAGQGQVQQPQQNVPQLPPGSGGWLSGGLDAYDVWEDQDAGPGQGWDDFPG